MTKITKASIVNSHVWPSNFTMSNNDKLLTGDSFTDLKLDDEPDMSNLLDSSKLMLDESMLLENSLVSDPSRVSIQFF